MWDSSVEEMDRVAFAVAMEAEAEEDAEAEEREVIRRNSFMERAREKSGLWVGIRRIMMPMLATSSVS
jgi:hypothetical protein